LILEGISVDDVSRIAQNFTRAMGRESKSEATIRIYMWGINDLIKFARKTNGIVNRETLERWSDASHARLSRRSFALAGTAVRQLLIWALKKDEIHDEGLVHAVPTGKYERLKIPSTLTPSTLMRLERYLLSLPESPPPNVHELRDRALFFYVKATAARVSEILQVRRETFERQSVRQKGGEQKSLTTPPGVARLIRDYLRARTDDEEWLWVALKPDHSVGKLQPAGVLKIWERLAKKAGVRRFTTQELRHTAATLLVERGHQDTVIMELLGSRDVRSIQGYKVIVADRLARARADLDVVY
jgi:site-specific recombinase XerD